MGNNPSKGPSGDGPDGHVHHGSAERKVARRTSLSAMRHQKATAADPSATRETAAGHPANYQGSPSHRRHSRNPPHSPGRSMSKPSGPDGRRQDYAQGRKSLPEDQSNPMQVPSARQGAGRDPVAPSGPPLSSYYSASQHLQRPPRMPLPIGDATTTPGSPISGPEDSHIQSMPADQLLKEQLEKGVSNLSSVTLDGEEIVDELPSYASSGVGKAVPTYIEWSGPGQKVYVTGTFVNWEKKFKLHRGYESVGSFSVLQKQIIYVEMVTNFNTVTAKMPPCRRRSTCGPVPIISSSLSMAKCELQTHCQPLLILQITSSTTSRSVPTIDKTVFPPASKLLRPSRTM